MVASLNMCNSKIWVGMALKVTKKSKEDSYTTSKLSDRRGVGLKTGTVHFSDLRGHPDFNYS